jgi:hypothetical protein
VNSYPRQLSFIGYKRSELRESPTVESCALRPSSPDPRANMFEILKHYRSLRAFGLRNYLFGEAVVDVFRKTAFLSGQFAKPSFRSQRSKLLKLVSQSPVPIANLFDGLAGVDFSVAIGSDVRHTQVDAERTVNVNWFRYFHFAQSEQIPVATDKGKIGLAAPEGKQRSLTLATQEWDALSPVERPDRYRRILVSVGQDTIIKCDRAQWREFSSDLLMQLVGISNFGDTAHDDLCGKAEPLTRRLIRQSMEGKLPKCACVPGLLTDVVAGNVCRFKRTLESISLLG